MTLYEFPHLAKRLARESPHGRLEACDLEQSAALAQLQGKKRAHWVMYDVVRSDRMFGPTYRANYRCLRQVSLVEKHAAYRLPELAILPLRVRQEFERLPERSKEIVRLFYWEGLVQGEIAKRLGLTEGRVSQIHSQVISQLRAAAVQ